MTSLETLAANADLILLAEIGALVHDLGKLSAEFVRAKATDGQGDDTHHLFLRRYQPQVPDRLKGHSSKQNRVETAMKYLASVDTDEARALHTYLGSQYLANSRLDLGGALRAYERKNPAVHQLITHTTEVVEEHQRQSNPQYGELILAEMLSQIPDDFLPQALVDLLNSVALPAYSSDGAPLLSETVIGEVIEGHHSPPAPWRVAKSGYRAMLRAPYGSDGLDSGMDKQLEKEKEGKQRYDSTHIATAFGHEAQRIAVGPDEDGLKAMRYQFAEELADALGQVSRGEAKPGQVRGRILKAAQQAFRQALGETRRAANDVTLWDHSYSVASLYKAALARVLLEGWTEPAKMSWRFLWVSVDGMSFFDRAHKVTDMLGRQQALKDALDKVRNLLEVEHPVGNEVYRDQNGATFVMPGLADGVAQTTLEAEVKELVLKAFRDAGLGEELVPGMEWNKEPVREEMRTAFGHLVARQPPPVTPDPRALQRWWQDPQAKGKEVCTICGVRPIGYDVTRLYGARADYYLEAAAARKVCGPCLQRRGSRSELWVSQPAEFRRTIWTDEVADDNGRLCLIAGRFVLYGWLDGTLVRTTLVAPGKPKNPSPARIRRCWDTTHQFWQDLVSDHDGGLPLLEAGDVIRQRPFRLRINPANVAELAGALGKYHVYDLLLPGGRTMSVVWVPERYGGSYLLSADNLWYLAGPEQLCFPGDALADDNLLLARFSKMMAGRELKLLEPSGYGRPAEVKTKVLLPLENAVVRQPNSAYTPYIPLLTEPATFMALVPASRALDVAKAIKQKYAGEMARVRDRLPLHMGLVFAPRRTPLAAVLDAGQAMLNMPCEWEDWTVAARGFVATFTRDGRHFVWQYPEKMGDNATEDIWYPHLLTVNPTTKAGDAQLMKENGDFKHVKELHTTVFVRLSRFDFEFLDTIARRFDIRYGPDGRRPRRTRPFLLDDLDRLERLWTEQMMLLKPSQRHQVIFTIEAAREAWSAGNPRGQSVEHAAFRQFVHDTLANAAWPEDHQWRAIDADTRQELEGAGVTGELADLAELHMQILKEE